MNEQEASVNEQPSSQAEKDTAAENTAPAKADLRQGEKAFAIAFFLLGAAAFWQSLQLWLSLSPPRAASAGALPLFVSAVWMVLSFVIVIENIRKKTPLSGRIGSRFDAIWQGLSYLFPRPVAIMLIATVAYCAALLLSVGFYISTSIYLWCTMCYLTRKNFLKNILWTGMCMGFIYVVFGLMFNVLLP